MSVVSIKLTKKKCTYVIELRTRLTDEIAASKQMQRPVFVIVELNLKK